MSQISNTLVVAVDVSGVLFVVGIDGSEQFQNLFAVELQSPFPFRHISVLPISSAARLLIDRGISASAKVHLDCMTF